MPEFDLTHGRQHGLSFDDRGRLRVGRGPNGRSGHGWYESRPTPAGAAAIRIGWTAQWLAPQQWIKHEGNPIFGPEQSGDWDDWTNGVSIIPFDHDTRYRMYYSSHKGGIGFAETTVDQPTTWTEHPASPVLTPREGTWEAPMLNQPRVVKVTESHWRMYYTGWGLRDAPGTGWALGLAESHDAGVTWTRVQDDPILERGGPDSPDAAAAVVPHLLHHEGRWWMWYTAGRLNPDGHQNIHLCLAWSDDGLHFEKHPGNPVLTDDFTDGAPRSVTSRCFVRRHQGAFQMWYSFAKPDYRICYAESLDGVKWERSPIQPVLDAGAEGAWDSQMVEYPEVQLVDDQWRLWFCGNNFGRVGFALGQPETRLTVKVRSGASHEPDDAWSAWRDVSHGEVVDVAAHVQLRAELASDHPDLSPALNRLAFEPINS